MNITANPHLNLTNLTDYKLSKAYQLENNSKTTPLSLPAKNIPVEVPKIIKILNTEATSTKSYTPKTSLVRKDNLNIISLPQSPNVINTRAPKRPKLLTLSSSPKRIKLETGEVNDNLIEICSPSQTELQMITKLNTSIPVAESPKNKLLALFEVTPDQYNELSERLSASERSNKVESILTSFLDNEKFETETLNENGKRIKHNIKISLFNSYLSFIL